MALMLVVVAAFSMYGSLESVKTLQPQLNRTMTTHTSSLNFIVDPIIQKQYDILDAANRTERCQRYNFTYNKHVPVSVKANNPNKLDRRQHDRRIFFGAVLGDERYNVIRMHAAEAYGLYAVVALVESDRTHTNTPRTLRFAPGTAGHDLIHSGIFGPNVTTSSTSTSTTTTRVFLDVLSRTAVDVTGMDRDEIQRQQILKRWKEAGMKENDVGFMADMDETMTRDFLLAAKQCDVPAFQPGQDCHPPRLPAVALVFEGSPECVTKSYWFHPEFMIGECIESIGNPKGRPKRVHGGRVFGWGRNHTQGYPAHVVKNGSYALANAADMRHGSNYGVAAYHFHNFFETASELRHKYRTNGHADSRIWNLTLSDIHRDDLDLMVRCVKDLPSTAIPVSKGIKYKGGLDSYTGTKPIFFLNETYLLQRHAQVNLMIEESERLYGSKYTGGGS